MMTILPVLSISTRAICTPAALTALTALVTSCCLKVDGARAMASYTESSCAISLAGMVLRAGNRPAAQPFGFEVGWCRPRQVPLRTLTRATRAAKMRAGFPGRRQMPEYSFWVGKARKVGKVLSVTRRPPFLTFLTFLAWGPRRTGVG